MTRRRTPLALLFALLLGLAPLAACGGDDSTTVREGSGEVEDEGTGTGNEGGTDAGAGGSDTGGD